MRKGFHKLIGIAAAAVMAVSAVSLSACGASFTPLEGDYSSPTAAVSNGGFVVEYGKYVYFINGVETYTSDNTYGEPVKGALMRILKSDLLAGNNNSETVIPSLMVASDYTSGIYIYDGRVYYATPNNVKNTSGQIENDYLDFKSAKLDGSDIQNYLRVSDNSTVYRYVQTEEGGTVYIIYADGSSLYSYNTSSKEDTELAAGVGAYVLNSTDKTDPYFYYTMSVQDDLDTDASSTTRNYNQIYRVRADVVEAPYEYTWDEEYLEDNDGEAPYTNLGTIVLDGIGSSYKDNLSQFTHDSLEGVTLPPVGYTYSLQSYTNGGIYFTRTDATSAGDTTGAAASLYYLSCSDLADGWNSVKGNSGDVLDVVAQSTNTSKASSAAIFYLDGNGNHHYLYVDGSSIYRADVMSDGSGENETEQEICYDASGATLISVESDGTYDYVWFTRSNGSGYSVERAVYNGSAHDYDVLQYTGEGGVEDNSPYQTVKVLDLQHASGWYNFEVIDDVVFIADAEPVGSTSYNYAAAVNLSGLTNDGIEKLNDKYNELMSSDTKVGYFAKLTADNDNDSTLSTALKYYFYTGKTEQFYENIESAVEAGKKDTYLYTEEEQSAFASYTADPATGATAGMFIDEDGKSYRVRSYFIMALGEITEDDQEAIDSYWETTLERYSPVEEEETLEDWEWALIAIAIALVVIGGAVGVGLFVKKRKAKKPQEERLKVDTTDDRSVNVYAPEEETEDAEEPDSESAEEETPAEEPDSEPAEEEMPADEPDSEPAEEAPAEDGSGEKSEGQDE